LITIVGVELKPACAAACSSAVTAPEYVDVELAASHFA